MSLFKKPQPQSSDRDPMNLEVFPYEIIQLLLDYLPVEDLLNGTLVSKSWNETIGSSVAFKKKVAIKLHSWNEHPPTEILKSNRTYEIVSLSNFKLSSQMFHCLADKNWRTVTLSIGKVSSQKTFVKIMDNFITARNLRIMSTNIRELNSHQKVELPDLESLVLSDVTLDLFDTILVPHPSLKVLSLRYVSCDILSPRRTGEAIVEFLILNPQINNLEINYVVTNDLFMTNICEKVDAKFKVLTIGLDETQDAVKANIEKFLNFQGNELEHLKLVLHQKFVKKGPNEWGYWDQQPGNVGDEKPSNELLILFNAWNSMTHLKSLSLRFLKKSSELPGLRDLSKSLRPNTNLKTIFIQFMDVTIPSTLMENLLRLAPNLHTLYVSNLTSSIVRYAASNLKLLRVLQCFSFEENCQQEYAELKASRNDINNLIVIGDQCAFG